MRHKTSPSRCSEKIRHFATDYALVPLHKYKPKIARVPRVMGMLNHSAVCSKAHAMDMWVGRLTYDSKIDHASSVMKSCPQH